MSSALLFVQVHRVVVGVFGKVVVEFLALFNQVRRWRVVDIREEVIDGRAGRLLRLRKDCENLQGQGNIPLCEG